MTAARRIPTRRASIVTVAAASFGFVVTQLDVTIVNVALPTIGADFASPLPALQWVVDGYTLGFAALLLSAGVLCDQFGAKRIYIIGLLSFAGASAICGLAQTTGQLVGARILQGLCATLLVPPSLALVNHACGHDRELRGKAIATWTAAGGVSIGAGPVLGGLLSSLLTWRAIFLVNLPLCLVGIVLALRCAETEPSFRGRFDWIGQVLVMVAMAALLGAIIEVGARGPSDAIVLASGATAVLVGMGFLFHEGRTSHPMLPLGLFGVPSFSPAIGFGVAANLAYYGVIFVLSLYLQTVRQFSPAMAGLVFVPLTGTFIVSNIASGVVMARVGCRIPMIVGALVAACGYALLLRFDADTPAIAMMVSFVLIPAGMGLGVPAMTTAILGSVAKDKAGTASGVLNAARQAGGAIGVAAFGSFAGHLGLVGGLHLAAVISASLLAVAALLAWSGIARPDARAE